MKTEAEMMAMAADINKSPKGEDPSGPRVCDCKEDKEPAPMTVKWGGGSGTILSYSTEGHGTAHKGETKEDNYEEEALLEISNRSAAMEEAVAKEHLSPSKVSTTGVSRHFAPPSAADRFEISRSASSS